MEECLKEIDPDSKVIIFCTCGSKALLEHIQQEHKWNDDGTEFTERENNSTFNPRVQKGNSILPVKTRVRFNPRR